MRKIVVLFIAVFGVCGNVAAYTQKVVNATPYDLEVKINVVAGVDKVVKIQKHTTKNIGVGGYLTKGITVNALNIAEKYESSILKESLKLGVAGNITYYIFCEPTIDRKSIPGGYSDIITKVKFFLTRLPRTAYPGGLIDSSDEYIIVKDETQK